ncbi:hypothetical protein LT493_30395 [Streptomyces tricolor]|nr:hypothetical protein [Streptomyces tricolor]
MTNASSLSWLYEYARASNADNLPTIQAFSASHEPSPWMGDRQTFQLMPSAASGTPDTGREAQELAFRHENETARPVLLRGPVRERSEGGDGAHGPRGRPALHLQGRRKRAVRQRHRAGRPDARQGARDRHRLLGREVEACRGARPGCSCTASSTSP